MSSRKPKKAVGAGDHPQEFAAVASTQLSSSDLLTYFVLFAIAATNSTFYNSIWDCDESMNYFEPLHELLFGYGFQTWEYSPTYALRSYFYLLGHMPGAFLSAAFSFLTSTPLTKIAVFYGIRWVLGMIGALCNTYLTASVHRRFGISTAQSLQVFLLITPGMFISITSFLPSTFAMYCFTAMLAAWMNGNLVMAFYLVALSAIVGWPFSAFVGLPLAIYALKNRGILFCVAHGIGALVMFLLPSVIVDSQFYGKIVAAPLNIVAYNVLGGAGPELYGVEPWYYYLLNGFLNFNFILPLALICPLLVLLLAFKTSRWAAASNTLFYVFGTFLWLGYMSLVPHKEERFLFVIYPSLCFAAALSLTCISELFGKWRLTTGSLLAVVVLVVVAVSVSRTAALYINYEAPTSVYTHLYYKEAAARESPIELLSLPKLSADELDYVCVGKEWYRFPTHFFLPPHLRVKFIKDGFDGQLPQYYGPASAQDGHSVVLTHGWDSLTGLVNKIIYNLKYLIKGEDEYTKKPITPFSRIPAHFNDLNKEELSRYGKLDDCKYWVTFFETDQQYTSFLESANGTIWREEYKAAFLSHAESRHPLFRAFYVPTFSEEFNTYGHYVLLERKASVVQNN